MAFSSVQKRIAAVSPGRAGSKEAGQPRREVGEGDLLGDERVEAIVGQERQSLVEGGGRGSQRGRREAATRPTWDETSLRRRLWKSRPSGAGTIRSPYQLISTTVASVPAQASAQARPDAVALAWNTTSASPGASRGLRTGRPAFAATARRDRSMSTMVTSAPGMARRQRRHEAADDARADDEDAVAGAGAGIPQGVEGRLHVGGENRAPGGNALRHRRERRGRRHEAVLVRMEREDRPAADRAGPSSAIPTAQ